MKICKKCVLDENFPGISFDEQGICSFCQKVKGLEEINKIRKEYHQKFLSLLDQKKNSASYDLLMAYSGGKDSTYTMALLVEHYGLRVLALTFDNGFISPFAEENIKRVTDNLSVDHITVRPSFSLLKKIFVAASQEDFFPAKAMERASSICTCCIGFVKSILLKTALEKNIPFIGFGWSPGQAPIQSSVMKTNPKLVAMAQKSFWPKIEQITGENLSRYYLNEDQLQSPAERFPINVHPLAFHEYDEEKIKKEIRAWGWREVPDTDPNSSNCLLNVYANKVHMERWGFHPYAWEMAGIVRTGGISRKEALNKIYEEPAFESIKLVLERLGLA